MVYKANIMRKLASSFNWQMLYARAKELSSLRLFENDSDLTVLQTQFLYWLEIYQSLATDLALKEKNISPEVIADEIRCDAYLLWKSKNKNKEQKTPNKKEKDTVNNTGIPNIIFKGK